MKEVKAYNAEFHDLKHMQNYKRNEGRKEGYIHDDYGSKQNQKTIVEALLQISHQLKDMCQAKFGPGRAAMIHCNINELH